MTAKKIIESYNNFFENKNHKRISGVSLVPENDPTTLFTSSGMQSLIPYLLGEKHPQGKRLVNVQNCFRAQDIDEIGDNRHTTFFRMLGNWSLGDYFKREQLSWIFTFLTEGLGLDARKLYVTVFQGNDEISQDSQSIAIWQEIFAEKGIDPKIGERIFLYGVEKNWWSRSGTPDKMPAGEPGGPDSEIFYDFETTHDQKFGKTCHVNCDCGRFVEVSNSVFMQYQKQADGSFRELPKQNVDHGGGLERFIAATENKHDMFETSLFAPIITSIEKATHQNYQKKVPGMRIITDHFIGASFMLTNNVMPSNKEQGYILRRLIRRGLDHFYQLQGKEIAPVLEKIAQQYAETDPVLGEQFEKIKLAVLEEEQKYKQTLHGAKRYIEKKYGKRQIGDELMGIKEITAEDAFVLYATHGLSPTQIKSLGYTFEDQSFAKKMEEHQKLSRDGAARKFTGGLADHQKRTIMGHTATHLLHQALRDILGSRVYQTGSNITKDRVRFDFNFDRKLTDYEIQQAQGIVNKKIEENLPVRFEIMSLDQAKKLGAIGLFDEKYGENVKIYFIGGGLAGKRSNAYSVEFCGGPHVEKTAILKKFSIIKQENIGHGQRRIYATVG